MIVKIDSFIDAINVDSYPIYNVTNLRFEQKRLTQWKELQLISGNSFGEIDQSTLTKVRDLFDL